MFTIGTDSPDSEDVVGSSVRSSSVLSRLSAMEVTEATPIEVVPTPVSEEDHQRIKLPAYIVKQGWLQKRGKNIISWMFLA